MRKTALALLLLASSFAGAQNWLTVTGARVYGGGNALLPAGSITFTAVDSTGAPIGYQAGGGGQVTNFPTTCAITAGVIAGGCLVANVSVSNPSNFCYAVAITDANNKLVLGGPASGYQCVQPQTSNSWCSLGACDFDQYVPNLPAAVTALMPPPAFLSLGGVYAFNCPPNQVATGVDVTGLLLCQAGLGGGNVSSSGTPLAGQAAQWADAHTLQGIGTTGTGNAVLNSSPVLVTPIFTGLAAGSVSGTASALAATPAQCTSGQFATGVTATGAANCSTPVGSGNVNNVGTPTSGQLGMWTGATTIQGVTLLPTANSPAFTGDVFKAAASLGTTVIAVNNGVIPVSKTLVGTNGLGQFIDASAATLSNNTTGTAAALGAAPSLCSSGQAAQGVLANGNATGCFMPSTLSGLAVGTVPQVGSGGNNLVNSSPALDNGVTTANALTYAGSGGMYAASFNSLNPSLPLIFKSPVPGALPVLSASTTQLTVGPDGMWHPSYNGANFEGGLVAEPGTPCAANQVLYDSTAGTGSTATVWSCAGLTAPLAVTGGSLGFPVEGGGSAVQMSNAPGTTAAGSIVAYDAGKNVGLSGLLYSANQFGSATPGGAGIAYTGSADSPGANLALGYTILRGASLGGSGAGSSSHAGGIGLWGGPNSAAFASSGAGHVQIFGGVSIGSTQGLQGLSMIGAAYVKGSAVTQWNLECFSAAMTVADCGASPAFVVGVAELVGSNTVQVITSQQMFINASAAVTLGHTVCAGTTAGEVTDSGGTALCTGGQVTVGVVMAVSGTYSDFPDGLGAVTASSTLPLVQKVMK